MVKTAGTFIGVDGGGSRSRGVLVGPDGRGRRADGGPLNPNRAGPAGVTANLTALLRELTRDELLRPLHVDGVCLGLSGRSHPLVPELVRRAFADAEVTCDGPRLLVTDGDLVLEAGFGAAVPSGVALIAGTGSLALARDRVGRSVRAGGFGPVLGDEGGGHWIGIEALKSGLRSLEGGSRTALCEALDQSIGVGGVATAPARMSAGEIRPSMLAPVVCSLADSGDAEALAIVRRAAAELAALVARAARLAGLPTPFDVVATGGVVCGCGALRAELTRDVTAAGALTLRLFGDVTDAAVTRARAACVAGAPVPLDW